MPLIPEKKKYKILIEMEGYGKDGTEIIGPELYQEVEVEAESKGAAEAMVDEMDFGNRRVSFVNEPEEI